MQKDATALSHDAKSCTVGRKFWAANNVVPVFFALGTKFPAQRPLRVSASRCRHEVG